MKASGGEEHEWMMRRLTFFRAGCESKRVKCKEIRPIQTRPACYAACSPLRYALATDRKEFRGDAAA
ncbi:hypothetical protein SAMN02990966_01266 [Rhodospirillales bacterium URHD0017]|nr:hypothetical protein SAMN02990966_01266 [Rhodospirillales bacterium URHD0017]